MSAPFPHWSAAAKDLMEKNALLYKQYMYMYAGTSSKQQNGRLAIGCAHHIMLILLLTNSCLQFHFRTAFPYFLYYSSIHFDGLHQNCKKNWHFKCCIMCQSWDTFVEVLSWELYIEMADPAIKLFSVYRGRHCGTDMKQFSACYSTLQGSLIILDVWGDLSWHFAFCK